MDGLDPVRLRDLGVRSSDHVTVADAAHAVASRYVTECDLWSNVVTLCTEISEESGLLARVCSAKATEMEVAASGGSFGFSWSGDLLDALTSSLDDGVGDDGATGDSALDALSAGFGYVDADGDDVVSHDELVAAAADSALPSEFRAAAQYLLDNPSLTEHISMVSRMDQRLFGDGSGPLLEGSAFTADGVEGVLRQNEILRTLSDRSVFDELESASNGELDGELSTGDLESILDSTDASPDARRVAEMLLDDELAWTWFRQGADGGLESAPILAVDRLKTIAFDDVIGFTVNQHVFADDPAAARDFVLSLAADATWTDVSGKSSGIDIRVSSDDGVRALAAASLAASPTLAEQVNVIASLPESRGGERNRLITYYYAELAGRMNERLNIGLDAGDPTAAGHTGANWMQFAPWASNSVAPAITADLKVYGMSPTWSDRQYAADGNQYIFGDVAIRYAQFLDAFPPDKPITEARIEKFFALDHPIEVAGNDDPRLFADGHSQLRDSFAYYLAAIEEPDHEQRQQYAMMGNILIATHEQAGAQHALSGLVDLDVGDDGVLRGFFGEAGGFVRSGSDEKFATSQMSLQVGFDRDPIRMSEDVPETIHRAGNLLLDDDLATTLNPDGRPSVEVGGVGIGFDGGPGDVSLPSIGGWHDPVAGTEMDAFPTNVAEWADEAGFELSESDREVMEHFGQDPDDLPSTYGTDASNWADQHQRQWFIANLFQQSHADPILFGGLGDLTLGGDWGQDLGYLPDTVRGAAER